jgi:hypothetical protein
LQQAESKLVLMANNRIRGVRLKIERAKRHISDLDVRIRAFCDSEPYTLGINQKLQIRHVALYVSDINPIPDDVPLIIGDAVHNLRSALDHLAWQLVESGGGTPDRNTYFPICKSPQHYTSAISKGGMNAIAPGAIQIIAALQPHGTKDDTLWHIHELDRWDKHRLVLTTATALNKWSIIARGQEIGWPEPAIPLKRGHEIVNVPADTYHRTGHKNFKLGIDIAFGESEVVAGKSVLETLNHMADFVDVVVTQIEPFLN